MISVSEAGPECPCCGTAVSPPAAFNPELLLVPLECPTCHTRFEAFWQVGQYWLSVTDGEKEMWAFYRVPRDSQGKVVTEP